MVRVLAGSAVFLIAEASRRRLGRPRRGNGAGRSCRAARVGLPGLPAACGRPGRGRWSLPTDYRFSGFFDVFRPVMVDAATTRTAATSMATIQRTQSTPGLPLPPNAV